MKLPLCARGDVDVPSYPYILAGLQQASTLNDVQKKFGVGRASLGSLSESVSVFDPELHNYTWIPSDERTSLRCRSHGGPAAAKGTGRARTEIVRRQCLALGTREKQPRCFLVIHFESSRSSLLLKRGQMCKPATRKRLQSLQYFGTAVIVHHIPTSIDHHDPRAGVSSLTTLPLTS